MCSEAKRTVMWRKGPMHMYKNPLLVALQSICNLCTFHIFTEIIVIQAMLLQEHNTSKLLKYCHITWYTVSFPMRLHDKQVWQSNVIGYAISCLRTFFIIGYKLAQSPCCYFEMNSTETTCNLNISDLPSSMMGNESVLVLELFNSSCNFVSNMNQLLVLVEHIHAGVCTWQY